ncbi:MAG: DUF2730 domain-containing protein [Stutzerimonas stutzeri]|nr:MAG: DUF2730 domain-containing protein [Stutzerimonas stutzeri]
MIDVAAFKDWVGLVALLISVGTSIVLFIGSGSKRNAEKLDRQEVKLTEHDRRIQAVENELQHLPDKDTVNKLQVDMTDLKGQIAVIAQTSAATERATRRVEEFLLRQKD